jgi:hypothetical protein
VPPGGNFPIPSASSTPLLAFRCGPGVKPYLPSDSTGTLLVDSILTYSDISGATPITAKYTSSTKLTVTAQVNGKTIAKGSIPLNATKAELPLALKGLIPRSQAYDLSCTATINGQNFSAKSELAYLPLPKAGSVTKMDLKTGALLARPATGKGGSYAPVFPIGYYTNFGDYLATNLSLLNDIKAAG